MEYTENARKNTPITQKLSKAFIVFPLMIALLSMPSMTKATSMKKQAKKEMIENLMSDNSMAKIVTDMA